jgi:hypothetical protein
MFYRALIVLCVILSACFSNNAFSQTRTVKSHTVTPSKKYKEPEFTRLSLKAGVNISVVYLTRNIKDKNNEPGFCAGGVYEFNNFVRASVLYTHFKTLNIEPTWYNVKANTYEANLEIMARFPNKKTIMYPFTGLSYNTFNGFFTGQSDYLNLKEFYGSNTTVKDNWLGVNLGTGIEHNFGILGIYMDYRMRVGRAEKAINIMDVCYTAGLKVRFPYGRLAKTLAHPDDRFHWF